MKAIRKVEIGRTKRSHVYEGTNYIITEADFMK